MKENRSTKRNAFILCAVSLIAASYLEYNKTKILWKFDTGFVENVLIGIFSSALVTFLLTRKNYKILEKKNAIYVYKFLDSFNDEIIRIKYIHGYDPEKEIELIHNMEPFLRNNFNPQLDGFMLLSNFTKKVKKIKEIQKFLSGYYEKIAVISNDIYKHQYKQEQNAINELLEGSYKIIVPDEGKTLIDKTTELKKDMIDLWKIHTPGTKEIKV